MKPLYIIEDEPLMLKYYSGFIDYESLGIKVAGLFSDAESAIDVIRKTPGIVVTDINMPGMSGLELIEKLKTENNGSVFIVLSGYDDFYLVKKAFKLGVVDYLLKAEINEEVYTKLLKRIIMSENISLSESAFTASRDDLVKQLLWGHIFEDSKYDRIKLKKNSPKGILVSKITNWNEIVEEEWGGDKELLQCGVQNIISEVLAEYENCEFFFDSYDKLILIIECEKTQAETTAFEIARKIKEILEKIFDYHICFGFSGVSSERKDLLKFLTEAEQMVKYSFLTGRQFNVYKESYGEIPSADTLKMKKKFLNQLAFLGMKEKFEIENESDFFPNKFSPEDTENIIKLYTEYLSALKDNFGKYGIAFPKTDSGYFYRTSASELSRYIISKLSEINSKLRSQENIMQVIEEYIEKNYAYNITLQSIAGKFNIDYFYLSRKFVSHFDMSFRKFINKVRMEKAMELIKKSDYKLKDIAELVGYENYESFSKTFNKHFGKTPTDFMKMRDSL